MAENIPQHVATRIREAWQGRVRIGTVTASDGVQWYVKRPGFAAADPVSYPVIDGPVVAPADEVLMIDVTGSGGFVVLGKVLHN